MACGQALGGAPRERLDAAGRSSRAVDERRRVTVLFADLADYTPLAERFDAEDVKDAVERCLRRLGRDVEDCGGKVLRYLGALPGRRVDGTLRRSGWA